MPRYFDLEVSLAEIHPRIWRRFLLRSTFTFAQLHRAIQDSLGWEDRHLWEFRVPTRDRPAIAGLALEDLVDRPTPDARTVKLNSYFTGKSVVEWCEYLYDFGDDWVHEVKLHGLISQKETFRRRLIGGSRTGPPEDCFGVPGYQRLVEFLDTGSDPFDDPEGLREWIGQWRPDAYEFGSAKADFDR